VRHVTGLEIKPHDHGAACAINRRENVVFLLQSLLDYEPQAKHDAVVALDVIEHLTAEVGDQFIQRMAHCCKQDGIVAIGTPSIHSYPYQGKYSQAAHVKCYDQPELMELMDRHFGRILPFSMNDEIVHTGHPKLAWYYFMIGFMPRHN
jgi:hypothetical protein